MEISKNSASQIATQGIQTGFNKLAENSQNITTPLNTLESVYTQKSLRTQTSPVSLEASLINNQQISTQIQSLAKVIKTEDGLIGQLFDDWA